MKLNSMTASVRRVAGMAIGCLLALGVSAQNLVPNPDFEQLIDPEERKEKDFRAYGMVKDFSMDWSGATESDPDLYLNIDESCKKPGKVTAPCNDYGFQETKDGVLYAGFRAYSKSPKLKRSYLQVKLTEKLVKNQQYCVSFDLSLADLSRYAVPDIGLLFSDRKIEQAGMNPIIQKPSVMHPENKVHQYSEGWDDVCGIYTADGTEQYIIIGCFVGDASIEAEKVRRPQSPSACSTCYNEQPQQAHAYYYVDNVVVEGIQAKSQCKCAQAGKRNMEIVYVHNSSLDADATAKERVEDAGIYYPFLKRMPDAVGDATLAEVVKILQANKGMKLDIMGHCDNDEFTEGKINVRYKDIGRKRAELVKRKLEDMGIAEGRLAVVARENEDPASTRDTEIARSQNRRVSFVVR